jgi:leucyl-tRNA synthetase
MSDTPMSPAEETPAHRYDANLAGSIEQVWQQRWLTEKTFEAPNPVGPLSDGFDKVAGREKLFVMDMFPYPSGSGLHTGHPLGYIGTDVYARYWRMAGRNVLHTMGYDAFGLPAEQYAVQTGTHPRTTTEKNIENMRRQLGRLGLGHDPRRSIATTDVPNYRWTQWIFLQLFNAWFDTDAKKARPISELVSELDSGIRSLDGGQQWSALSEDDKRRALETYRLVYTAEAPVNWCPALGTVLANEEVTNEGRSERGNYPVYRRPMRQWMMRITAYADRLIEDLDTVEWTDAIKLMQRNWIGRSTGAEVTFEVVGGDQSITVFTTRPDTLFGATYMVLAPEHPLVDEIAPAHWPHDTPIKWKGVLDSDSPAAAIADYRHTTSGKTDLERQVEAKDKTGVFTGAFARNPVNGDEIPIFVSDYVLMGYGTGAIMAVPAHDNRDFAFARKFGLPITAVIQPSDAWAAEHHVETHAPADTWPEAYTDGGVAIHSHNNAVSLDGLSVDEAKTRIAQWLESKGSGRATTTYKLRDWLFSRQRYWGEPFPIVWDERNTPIAVPDHLLPVELPEVTDYAPTVVDNPDDAIPEPPLGRATDWKTVTLDLGDGPRQYRRELNTMPQWAGSCWYYLAYIDPHNQQRVVEPENEQYWMNVDLYVGGVEHAVLHLLYARFWHKALYDLGHVSTIEPFQRLFNQGMVQADAFQDERGIYVDAFSVVNHEDGTYSLDGKPVFREIGKMGKSKKNAVNPDDIYEQYGADSLRLYEMSMGPLDADRPWTATGIVGLYRFLQRFWRNVIDEETGVVRVTDVPDSPDVLHEVHKTIAGVRDDMEGLRFNTAISKLIELNNFVTKSGSISRPTAETMVLLLAPLAPHICEELWSRLGHTESLAWHPVPVADPAHLVSNTVEIPVQVQGKVRGKVIVAADLSDDEVQALALADENVARHLEGKTIRKVIVIRGKMVNIVAG